MQQGPPICSLFSELVNKRVNELFSLVFVLQNRDLNVQKITLSSSSVTSPVLM